MNTKDKAMEIYNRSIKLHGLNEAKKQALNSAVAAQSLAPFDQQKFWDAVIKEIQFK